MGFRVEGFGFWCRAWICGAAGTDRWCSAPARAFVVTVSALTSISRLQRLYQRPATPPSSHHTLPSSPALLLFFPSLKFFGPLSSVLTSTQVPTLGLDFVASNAQARPHQTMKTCKLRLAHLDTDPEHNLCNSKQRECVTMSRSQEIKVADFVCVCSQETPGHSRHTRSPRLSMPRQAVGQMALRGVDRMMSSRPCSMSMRAARR